LARLEKRGPRPISRAALGPPLHCAVSRPSGSLGPLASSRPMRAAPRPQPGPRPAKLLPAWAAFGPDILDRSSEMDGCPVISPEQNYDPSTLQNPNIHLLLSLSALQSSQRQRPCRPSAPVKQVSCRSSPSPLPFSFLFLLASVSPLRSSGGLRHGNQRKKRRHRGPSRRRARSINGHAVIIPRNDAVVTAGRWPE
jgi:hypothetical protein